MNYLSVALFFIHGFLFDGIGFCFESQSATAVFSYRALDFFWGVVTESVFVLGVHDEMPFCF